ncbi:putative inorganic phosphate cotransporter [Amyelois transitella]|uniref:putative inorganic phosphate cotransporter n=1 Tax=Amyelois transitella TaxID=680683 RepID=UPI00298F8B76|nr:putative inorganic phosphate cotransporter [Amyelois transitella]
MSKFSANEKPGDDNAKSNFDEDFKVSGWGVRHRQCVMLMVTLTTAYSLRACMGVALVGMVETNPVLDIRNNINNSTIANETGDGLNVRGTDYVANGFFNALMLTPPYPQFDWSKKVQDMVISAFFFGYMLLQIPAGQLAHRFGSRRLIAGAMFINCAASVLFPTVTFYGGWITAAAFRMILGLSQACLMPSTHTFLGKWTTLEERGRLSGMIYGAQALGPVLGLPLTGFIAASPVGWPGVFRFYGTLAGICGAIIWFFCADSPAQHKKISAAERRYIEEALRQKGVTKHLKVPWSRLLRHRGLYAIVVAHIGNTWGQLTLYSEVPAYMDKVMGVNIKANGMLSALPFLMMFIMNFFFSWLFDMLIVKKYIGVTLARKLAQSIGSISSSVGLIILAFAPKNIYVVETIMVIMCGLNIASHYGFLVNHIDISPNFAGTMMSLSNFSSNGVGVLAPIVAGIILTDVTSVYLWRWVFFVSSGLYFFTNAVYLLLGTSELADWNEPESAKDNEEADAMMKKEQKD